MFMLFNLILNEIYKIEFNLMYFQLNKKLGNEDRSTPSLISLTILVTVSINIRVICVLIYCFNIV
jgi:hypothetical protein